MTPWQRLSAAAMLEPEGQQLLQLRIALTKPRQLRQDIYAALAQLFALPCAAPEQVEDVFETLTAAQIQLLCLRTWKEEGRWVTFSFR